MAIFTLVLLAFSSWMIFDAIRRSAELHWYLIILLFQPFGALIYFFAVKVRDYDFSRAVPGNPPLSKLKDRAAAAPSAANRLALADALHDKEAFEEAASTYQSVLDANPEDRHALLGKARCLSNLGRTREACDAFEKLMELDRAYADYSAALEYAETLWQDGQRTEAVELLEALSRVTRRFNHRVAHAHYLSLVGHGAQARTVIEELLGEHEAAPAIAQRRNTKWAERARRMLAELDHG